MKKDKSLFLRMSFVSYLTAAAIQIYTIYLGVKLFGSNSASFALNSFHPSDPLALLALGAFGTSVLASYPLIFLNMRNWFMGQAAKSKSKAVNFFGNRFSMTALLLSFIGGVTSVVTDIGVVGSLSGAILGSMMIFIFPPIIYIRALQKQQKSKGDFRLKIAINSVLLGCGSLLAMFGAGNVIASILN